MSLKLRKVNAEVRDPESEEMIPAGLLGSDALSTIEQAKDDAIEAVEDKGAETLASIPDDYSTLSGSVGELKTQLNTVRIQTDPTARLITTSGKYWKGNVGDVISTGSHNSYAKYDVLPCRYGDKFYILASGGSQDTYYILDSNNIILYSYHGKVEEEITINEVNAAYIAINQRTDLSFTPEIYLITTTEKRIDALKTSTEEAIDELEGELSTATTAIEGVKDYATYLNDFINMADMIKRVRAGSKTFSYEGMNSGYLTIIFDDGRHDLSTVESICEEYNIPLCAAISTRVLTNTCDNGDTVKEVCESIVANGGEILSHGVQSSALTSSTDYEWLKRELGTSKQILTENGFTIRGFIKPGGTGAISWDGNNLQRFTQLFYDYANSCGDDAEYKKARIYLGYTLDRIKEYIDDAALNHKWFTTFSHTLDGTEEDLNETKFRTIIEYALSKNIIFKTYAYMYDTFGTWS